MNTRKQANAERREDRRRAREHLAELRRRLRDARVRRKQALFDAKERCRADRLAARERARALRVRVLEELRETVRSERAAARDTCTARLPFASLPVACPVRALERWIAASGITEGPIFRAIDQHGHLAKDRLHPCSVARIVKRYAERAGLDPLKFSGHSLRSGFATSAAKKGKSLDAIMRQTLHRSERVARTYIRHAKLFDDNAAGGLL